MVIKWSHVFNCLKSLTAYPHYGEGVMELVAAKKIVQHKCARPMLHARTLGF
jgi:hypothetical protein